jgi:hypothetical protein
MADVERRNGDERRYNGGGGGRGGGGGYDRKRRARGARFSVLGTCRKKLTISQMMMSTIDHATMTVAHNAAATKTLPLFVCASRFWRLLNR